MRSLILLLFVAALPAEDGKPVKPVLVHADATCFVHAVRGMPVHSGDRFERPVGPGCQLLHTLRATGEMIVLVPATGTVAINTRRISFVQTRNLGVAADAERLYVVVWSSGRIYDRPPEPDTPVEGGSYKLCVFWLADGSAVPAPALDAKGLPKAAPPETAGKGPLAIVRGGVECYGTRAIYEGRELKQP